MLPTGTVGHQFIISRESHIQSSMTPLAEPPLNSHLNQQQESVFVNSSQQVAYLKSITMPGIEYTISTNDRMFDGFNLFVLMQRTRTVFEESLITNISILITKRYQDNRRDSREYLKLKSEFNENINGFLRVWL